MLVSSKKFFATIGMIVIIAVQYAFVSYAQASSENTLVDRRLVMIAIVCFISFILELLIWRWMTGELFSPYFVFFLVLFIFSCGQSIGWATGLDIGDKDLWNRVDHGLNHSLLTTGLSYSMLAISFFHMGAIFATTNLPNFHNPTKWDTNTVLTAFESIGRVMLVICIPAFIAKTAQDVFAVASGGYSSYYVVNSSRSALMSLVSILSDYYQPCMLILLISNRENARRRHIIVGAMMIDVVFSLYIGGRSGAVMTLLGILLAYHYFVRPFTLKETIIGAVGGYIGIAFLNGLATIRGTAGRGISDFISVIGTSFGNVIGSFIGELGWTLTSICWTMELTSVGQYPLRYGMSYIASVVAWVPSVVFGGRSNHPAVIWANLSDWLQQSLHMSYGPGYTMVAESYLNFAWFGVIAMTIEGFCIAKLIAKVRRDNANEDILGATIQVMIIMTIMKSLVRSSLSVAIRSAVFTLIPMYLLIRITLNKVGGRR